MNTSSRLLLLWLDLDMLLPTEAKSCSETRTAQRDGIIVAEEAGEQTNTLGNKRDVVHMKLLHGTCSKRF